MLDNVPNMRYKIIHLNGLGVRQTSWHLEKRAQTELTVAALLR